MDLNVLIFLMFFLCNTDERLSGNNGEKRFASTEKKTY